MARPYRLQKRAESAGQTRARIVEAAISLHGTKGPACTTIKDVAELAGVERLTVYRHFRDEAALLQACSGKWLERNPPPAWSPPAGEEPKARTERMLQALYNYYARTVDMWSRAYRDQSLVPALEEPMRGWNEYLDATAGQMSDGWRQAGKARRKLWMAARHAVDFRTYSSWRDAGASERFAVRLMSGLIDAAARD
jgi:AcrR family transcriptional regulator